MSYRQIEICSKRLADVSQHEAEIFRERMEAASDMTHRANELRRLAWADYRAVLGVLKRDGNG